MKFFSLVSTGLEKVCVEELKELTGAKGKINSSAIEFDLDKDLLKYIYHVQSVQRVMLFLARFQLDNIKLEIDWSLVFKNVKKFRIDIENVKGQENRHDIAKSVSQIIFNNYDKVEIDFKNPEVVLVIYFTGKEYLLGLDITGEINKREFRLLPHSASFTGDVAYFIVRKSGFFGGEKLLVGYAKDGAIPIEAALYANKIKLREEGRNLFAEKYVSKKVENTKVFAFDPSRNVISARKNLKIACVDGLLEINKIALDELDVRYDKEFFDRMILHLTTKDEDKINEIYYQAKYVLKKKGTMLLITRENFELSLSENFKLISEQELVRGESVHKLWLLEKK